MEEIQVGEYARTKHNGIIRIREIKKEKVFNTYYEMGRSYSYLEDKIFIYYRNDDRSIPIDDILKHSFNLIDLIEEGDYVNGHKIIKVTKDTFTTREYGGCKVHHKECVAIKSIVTREQFASLEYKVEEK